MKTKTVTVNEGELLGPIDPTWDEKAFSKTHLQGRDETKAWEAIQRLQVGQKVRSSHSHVFSEVMAVGMYDGWPWWFPVPSYCVRGPLGGEWHPYYYIQSVQP